MHILENNNAERERFERTHDKTARAAWRRAMETATDGLPSWAARKPSRNPVTFDAAAAVALYRAGGTSLRKVADLYGVAPMTLHYHVKKAGGTASQRAATC